VKKILAVLATAFLLPGLSAAAHGDTSNSHSGQHGDAGPEQKPSGKPSSDAMPGPDVLPQQASNTARQVLDTVNQFVEDPGQALGDALSTLLGQEPSGPENESGSDSTTTGATSA
jgi:hypothetical protein